MTQAPPENLMNDAEYEKLMLDFRHSVGHVLGHLQTFFVPGAAKVSIVVVTPGDPDATICCGDSTAEELEAALIHLNAHPGGAFQFSKTTGEIKKPN